MGREEETKVSTLQHFNTLLLSEKFGNVINEPIRMMVINEQKNKKNYTHKSTDFNLRLYTGDGDERAVELNNFIIDC